MKNKAIIITICIFLTSKLTTAQTAHNLKPNSICKFVKGKKNMEGMTACNACAEQRKKDEKTLEAEFKKRLAEGKKQEAENLKKIQQDYVKRSAELKQKIEVQSKNVVTFALPRTVTTQTPNLSSKPKSKSSNGILYSLNHPTYLTKYFGFQKYLLNSRGDTVLDINNSQFEGVWGANKEKLNNFPDGVAIALLSEKVSYDPFYRQPTGIYDLINNRGERLLNDNNIMGLYHLWGEYFFIGYGPAKYFYSNHTEPIEFQKAGIYNLKNKSFYVFDKRSGYNYVVVDQDISTCKQYDARVRTQCEKITGSAKAFVECITYANYEDRTYTFYIINTDGAIEKQNVTVN